MARILVLDDLHPLGSEMLKKAGHEVTVSSALNGEVLTKALQEIEAVIVRSATTVHDEAINASSQLKIIARAGVGTDNIDKKTAAAKNITVINAPLANTNAAAEHALAMMMSLARNIPRADRLMRTGQWPKKQCTGVEFLDKTIGVVGAGHVGQRVIEVALALRMTVLVADPALSEEAAKKLKVTLTDLETLFKDSDFVTLHIPLLESTKHLVNKKIFALMKNTAYLINCSRGGIVEENDLYNALKSGEIAGAAIDVFEEEPLKESALKELDNIVLTPHLGAASREAQITAARHIAEQLIDFFKTGNVKHPVKA